MSLSHAKVDSSCMKQSIQSTEQDKHQPSILISYWHSKVSVHGAGLDCREVAVSTKTFINLNARWTLAGVLVMSPCGTLGLLTRFWTFSSFDAAGLLWKDLRTLTLAEAGLCTTFLTFFTTSFIRFWDGMGVLWLEGALELEAPLLKAETISSSSNTDIGKILTSRTADWSDLSKTSSRDPDKSELERIKNG